ncbi:MAG: hypothetical protein BGO68_00530 [Candidatus Amoebophilus sp. 36-38]|nr:MAG: hypothetical protein BGO68_00530 [Candidatus Amoebophilus sp. 36-38]
MRNIISILTGAPWWVYIILVYLLYIGFRAIKPRTIWLPKLFILPIIITGLLTRNLFTRHSFQLDNLAMYILSLGIGGIISWLIFKNTKLIFDRAKRLVTLPGGYTTLILFMSIFVIRYFWGYIEATHPTPLPTYLMYSKIASSGIIAGLSFGRSITYLHKFFRAQ